MYKLVFIFSLAVGTQAWNNGLARTPPMGWMSWVKYECEIDCHAYPKECINENLYKEMVDKIVSEGYLSVGYNTVNIDDCWSEKKRDPKTNRLVPDKHRFPSGIKHLVDYSHGKGVQFGIYGDVGTLTCGGYPGTRNATMDFTEIDAHTFSDWGVDSLKLDGCYEPAAKYHEAYPAYTKALAKQTHKIVFACSWPAYLINKLHDSDWLAIKENCNYWRNYGDITDSWGSVKSIIEYYRQHAAVFAKYHGPGGWFDADMLLIGNDGLSFEQSKTQMAFWCLWSVPLLMSNDLRDIKPEFKAILQNKHLIAVNQDPLGIMGQNVINTHQKQVWVKKLSPLPSGLNPWVVLYFNDNTLGVPAIMSYKLSSLIPQLKQGHKYSVHDLFHNDAQIGHLTPEEHLTLKVKTSGSVQMVKLVPA